MRTIAARRAREPSAGAPPFRYVLVVFVLLVGAADVQVLDLLAVALHLPDEVAQPLAALDGRVEVHAAVQVRGSS